MNCTKSKLINLIEEVDRVSVDSLPVIMELVQWLPAHTIESFIEAATSALEVNMSNEDLVPDEPTEIG